MRETTILKLDQNYSQDARDKYHTLHEGVAKVSDDVQRCILTEQHIEFTRKNCYNEFSQHRLHNVVDRGVLQATWEELVGRVVHCNQLIVC